jgi:hypothetical protein
MPWFDWRGHNLLLRVRLRPRARRCSIGDPHGQQIKIAVTAPPVDGGANRALEKLLADEFSVAHRDVAVIKGASSRDKTVRIERPRKIPAWFVKRGGSQPPAAVRST